MPGRGHHVKSALVLYRESLGQEDTQPVAKGSKKKTGVSKVSNKKLGSKETKAKFLKLSNQEQQQFFSAERAARDLSEQQLIVRSEYGSTHGLVDSDGRGGSTYTATQLDTAVFNARDSVVDTASVYESLLADENLPRTFAAGEGQIGSHSAQIDPWPVCGLDLYPLKFLYPLKKIQKKKNSNKIAVLYILKT